MSRKLSNWLELVLTEFATNTLIEARWLWFISLICSWCVFVLLLGWLLKLYLRFGVFGTRSVELEREEVILSACSRNNWRNGELRWCGCSDNHLGIPHMGSSLRLLHTPANDSNHLKNYNEFGKAQSGEISRKPILRRMAVSAAKNAPIIASACQGKFMAEF